MPDDEITQISVGGGKVGIIGLKNAIEGTRALKGSPDEEIVQALFTYLKKKNYIPASAREQYMQAFLREFKKALGEKFVEEKSGVTIKILGPGCPSCHSLEQMVMAVVAELGLPAAIEHVTDLKEIAAMGVLGTPGLMINDEVKATGQSPSKEKLTKWLLECNAEVTK